MQIDYAAKAEKSIFNLEQVLNLRNNKAGFLCWENGVSSCQHRGKLKESLKNFLKKCEEAQESIALILKWGLIEGKTGRKRGSKTYYVILDHEGTIKNILNKVKLIFDGGYRKVYCMIPTSLGSFNPRVENRVAFKFVRRHFEPKMSAVWNEHLRYEADILSSFQKKGHEQGLQAPYQFIGTLISGNNKTINPTFFVAGRLYSGNAFVRGSKNSLYDIWPMEQLFKGMGQLVQALKKFHEQETSLGDIKTDNILRDDRTYELCFTDIGDCWKTTKQTSTRVITRNYSSIAEWKRVDGKETVSEIFQARVLLDIFCLGVTFYEMIMGSSMFENGVTNESFEERKQIIRMSIHSKSFRPYDRMLTDLIAAMTHPDPSSRASLEKIEKDLETLVKVTQNKGGLLN